MDTKFTGVRQFTQQAQWNLMMAHDAIIERRIMQAHHANRRQMTGVEYASGLSVNPELTLPKG